MDDAYRADSYGGAAMSISAMKCALQSLESVEKVKGWNRDSIIGRHCTQSAHFLRQAIAEAEKQEPAFYVIPATDRFGEGYEQTFWEDPAGFPVYTRPVVHEVRCTYPQCQATNGCVGACSKGQPDLAKVGEVGVWGHQREWVGLSDKEVKKIVDKNTSDIWCNGKGVARDVEAKLKEKNVPQP